MQEWFSYSLIYICKKISFSNVRILFICKQCWAFHYLHSAHWMTWKIASGRPWYKYMEQLRHSSRTVWPHSKILHKVAGWNETQLCPHEYRSYLRFKFRLFSLKLKIEVKKRQRNPSVRIPFGNFAEVSQDIHVTSILSMKFPSRIDNERKFRQKSREFVLFFCFVQTWLRKIQCVKTWKLLMMIVT